MRFRLNGREHVVVVASGLAGFASLVSLIFETRHGWHVVPGSLVVLFAALTIYFVCRVAWLRTPASRAA